MAHICIGIDIGSYSVKVAELESSSKEIKLNYLKEYKLNQDPSYDQRIELIDLFLRLSNESKDAQFIFGIKQNLVSLRRCQFPFRERHKIFKSVIFELEDEIPFLPEDIIFDVKVLEQRGSQSDILAVLCPKTYIRDILELCHDGSVYPSLLSVEGIATANVFSSLVEEDTEDSFFLASEESQGTASSSRSSHVVLQMGHTSSILMFFKGQSLVDVRSVDFGGKTVIDAIVESYQVQFFEAGRELRDKSYIIFSEEEEEVSTKEQIFFSDVIKKSFEPLIVRIQLILLEKEAELNLKYEEILISGSLSQIQNIGLHLTQRLGLPTNRLGQKRLKSIVSLDSASLVWGSTALGLALEGFKRPKDPAIDLLKGEFARKNDAFQRSWETWSEWAGMGLVMMVFFFAFSVARHQLATDLNDEAFRQVKKQGKAVIGLKGKKVSERSVKKWVKKKERIQQSLDVAKEFHNKASAMDILKDISLAVPFKDSIDLDVTKIEIMNTSVKVEGRVGHAAELKTLMSQLRKIAKDNVIKELKPSLKPESGKTAFSYKFQMQYPQKGGTL